VAWHEIRERGSALGLRLAVVFIRLLGHRLSFFVFAPIAIWYTLFEPSVRANLRRFHSRAAGRSSLRMVYRTLRNFADGVRDRFYVVSGRADLLSLDVHDPEPVHRLYEAGRGAILLGAHLGPLEVSRIWPEGRKFRINVLIYSAISPMLYRELRRADPEVEERMIQVDRQGVGFVLEAKERIERGEFVAVMGDRAGLQGSSVRLPFLGAEAEFPLGPYVLASTLRCPIVLTIMVRTGRDHYELFIEDFASAEEVRPAGRKERRARLESLARRYVERLEHYCREHPLQWYNFYDFWAEAEDE